MKKVLLVFSLVALIGMAAFAAGPYVIWNQALIPDGGDVATGFVKVGGLLSFGGVVEHDCPQTNPCGGVQQFTAYNACLDLYFGFNDVWSIPWSPFFGLSIEAQYAFASVVIESEIGFDDDWDGFPVETGEIEYWNTRLMGVFEFNTWAQMSIGSDFILDDSTLTPSPFIEIWIGDRGSCPSCN